MRSGAEARLLRAVSPRESERHRIPLVGDARGGPESHWDGIVHGRRCHIRTHTECWTLERSGKFVTRESEQAEEEVEAMKVVAKKFGVSAKLGPPSLQPFT